MAGGNPNSLIGRAFLQQSGMLGNPGSPGFISPSQLSQQASYKPGVSGPSNITPMPTMRDNFVQPVAPQAPQMSPLAQQMMQRTMPAQPIMGLPAALMQMRGQLNQPMMRGPMPTYRSPALDYRPNMEAVRQNLTRVQPSVYKTELDAARQRIADLEAAQQSQNNDNYWAYNQS